MKLWVNLDNWCKDIRNILTSADYQTGQRISNQKINGVTRKSNNAMGKKTNKMMNTSNKKRKNIIFYELNI